MKRTLGAVTSYYIYDGEKPVLEYKSTDLTHPARNLYGKGVDEILMRTDPTVNSGQAFYYGQDHEGSVTHLINGSGTVIEQYQYDAFGAPTMYNAVPTQISSTAYNNRFLFTGREYAATYQKTFVSAFNFYEYRARAYNPTLGRFMSEDPKDFNAGDYNLFRYCHNDPVDFTDPMGLTDINMSPELVGLIWQASVHSLNAYKEAGDRIGRSQFVVSRFDSRGSFSGPSLQKNSDGTDRINQSKGVKLELRQEYKQYREGQKFRYVEQESGKVRSGEKLEGVGHMHGDKTGHGMPQWSGTDINTASGTKTQAGVPVGRIDESKPDVMRVLVPQQEGGQPKERTFTAQQIDRMIEQGTEKALDRATQLEHSWDRKSQ